MASSSTSTAVTDSSTVVGDSDTEDASCSITSPTVSLLDRLRSPRESELARKRKVRCNHPPAGKRQRVSSKVSPFDPKSVTPSRRVKEFPGTNLTVSSGKLFCLACREEVGLKSSVVKNHIKSEKHKNGCTKLKQRDARERDIAEALTKYNDSVHLEGETLPMEQQVYRVKVLKAFLKAGTPLNKLNCFRGILEENAFRLTDRSHMANLLPFILNEEQDRMKQEILGRDIAVIFDGTTRLGEAMVILIRYVADDWSLVQRMLQVRLLAKSMTGNEIARELISTLSTKYGVGSSCLLAAMRDRASVNNVAVQVLQVVYPSLVDVGCFSHAINLAGEHFKVPTLSDFTALWVSLFAHSGKARLAWKDQVGSSIRSYSRTRWWSQWEVMQQLMLAFGDVEPFLNAARSDDIAPATVAKLLSILASKKSILQIELAAVVDVGKCLVQATYKLEGDGPLALECYEVIQMVLASIRTGYYPNLEAVSRKLSGVDQEAYEHWMRHGLDCVEPGLQHFDRTINGVLSNTLEFFKVARLFNPKKALEMNLDAAVIDCLGVVPFFDASTIANLKTELPQYLAKAMDVSPDYDLLQFWKLNSPQLLHWSSAAKKILLVQPSSAAAERVFSMLTTSFGHLQNQSLNDYIELSLMLQYNSHPNN